MPPFSRENRVKCKKCVAAQKKGEKATFNIDFEERQNPASVGPPPLGAGGERRTRCLQAAVMFVDEGKIYVRN